MTITAWKVARKRECTLCGEPADGIERVRSGRVICFDCVFDLIEVTDAALRARAAREARNATAN